MHSATHRSATTFFFNEEEIFAVSAVGSGHVRVHTIFFRNRDHIFLTCFLNKLKKKRSMSHFAHMSAVKLVQILKIDLENFP